MTEGLPIYFPKDLYHRSKVGFKGVLDTFGLVWESDAKCWVKGNNRVVGIFEGHKKPALLYVSGSDAFIDEMKAFAKLVGAEVRTSELPDVKDIRDKRKEESEQRKLETERQRREEEQRKIDEINKKGEIELSLLHVVENKVAYSRLLKLPDRFIIDWLKKEMGVDICFYYDTKGIQQVKVVGFDVPAVVSFVAPKSSKETDADYEESGNTGTVVAEQVTQRTISKGVSYLCEHNQHRDCGGYLCSCDCHSKKA